MVINFDIFDRVRTPEIILCNPNWQELYPLVNLKDRKAVLRYNAISEFSFTAYDSTNGISNEYFDYLQSTRVITVENVGSFIITKVVEIDNGEYKVKQVYTKSLEYEMSEKGVYIPEGTYKFYDVTNPEGTIINEILSLLPDWTIGSIDSDLWNLYRTFDVIDKNLYDFTMNDVEEAFECIFIFDTINKTISAKTVKNAITTSDVYFSSQNVIKELNLEEDSSQLKTALNIYGADDLGINTVNALGNNTIYNFSYYKNTEWMSQELINAITLWEDKVTKNNATHTINLSELKRLNGELLSLTIRMTELDGELDKLENVKAVKMEQGLDLADINKEIDAKEAQIKSQNVNIKQKESQIAEVKATISNIAKSLSFEENFTKSQYIELSKFVKVATYQNDAFVVTDSMTEEKKIEIVQELYDMGVEVLKRTSTPKYTFNVEAINFLNLIQYKQISQELTLGSEITIDMGARGYAYPVLLELEIGYDNADSISLGFGNRLRLDKSEYSFSEIFKDTVSTSSDVSFNKGKWGEGIKAKTQMNEYINNSLNASIQDIVNSDYQDILIDGSGIRCRRFNPTIEQYDPEQMWITGKSIVFSKDGFKTAETAIGSILLPDGSYSYGIAAQAIIGKLIAGTELVIENEGGTFHVDAKGVTLINARLIIRNENGDMTVEEKFDEVNQAVEDAKNEASSNLGDAITDINSAITTAKNEMSSNLNDAIGKVTTDIETIADGVVEIFYESSAPTSGMSHGDLWFDISVSGGNKLYRYNGNAIPKSWEEIQDKAIVEAFEKAKDAQSTADGKITSYYQNEPPVGTPIKPLCEGDLWVDTDNGNKLYRYSISTRGWVAIQDQRFEIISGDLSNAITDITSQMGNMAEALRDDMIEVFYQNTQPLNPDVGDLWVDTDDNQFWRYDGTKWESIQDKGIQQALTDAMSAQTTADGKITSYYQPNMPTGTQDKILGDGDLWVDTDDGNRLYRYSASRNQWIDIHDSRIDKVSNDLSSAISDINGQMGNLQDAIQDGMIDVFYQATQPTSAKDGDLWYNTGDKNKAYIYKNNRWETIQDKNVIDALDKAQSAQATADGKITSYYQNDAPIGTIAKPLGEGDLWVDINDNNKLYRYNATTNKWVSAEYSGVNDATMDILNHKTTTYYCSQSQLPAVDKLIDGDLWFDTSMHQGTNTPKNKLYRWNTVKWIEITDAQIIDAINKANNAQDTADKKIVTYYQATDPLLDDADVGSGDLWIDTDNNNTMYRYDGVKWVDVNYKGMNGAIANKIQEALDKITDVEAKADGKVEIFYLATDPSLNQGNDVKYGDIWVDISLNVANKPKNKMYRRTDQNTWESIEDSSINDIFGQLGTMEDAIDGKVTTYYCARPQLPPDGILRNGDLWVDTSNNNKLMIRQGIYWVDVSIMGEDAAQDWTDAISKATEALEKADQALALEDSIIDVFYQSTEPTNKKVGDLWFNTSTGRVNTYTSSGWKESKDQSVVEAINKAQQAMDKADTKITTYYQDTEPQNAEKGDFWIHTGRNNEVFVHNGSTFVKTMGDLQDHMDDVISGVHDSYFDHNQKYWSEQYNGQIVDSTNIGTITNDGISGSKSWKIQGQHSIYSKNAIPVDKDRLYKFTFKIKQLTHAKTKYPISQWFERTLSSMYDDTFWNLTWFLSQEMRINVGVVCLDKNFRILGTPKYFIANNQLLSTNAGWVTLTGSITGYGASSNMFANNTVYMRPTFTVNMPNGDGEVLVDSFVIEDVTEISMVDNKFSAQLGNAIDNIGDLIDSVNGRVDGVVEIFYSDTTPTSPKSGDIWYKTNSKNESFMYDGSKWVSIKDSDILKALEDARNAQDTADGKITTYYQATAPANGSVVDGKVITLSSGDLWFDIDDGNKIYSWRFKDNTWKWVLVRDATLSKVDNVLTVDGNITTSKLEGTLNSHVNNILSGVNMQVVMDKDGIWAMDNADKTKANRVVAMNENGILMAKERVSGNLNWRTAISPDGINADEINTGTLRALDMFGCNLEVSNSKNRITMNPVDGIKIQKKSGASWVNSMYMDISGDAVFSGKLIGNSININDRFTVDTSGNVIANSIAITGGQISNSVITGGSLNIGSGKFTVDTNGNVVMAGSISWGASNSPVKVQYSINGTSSWHTTFTSGDMFAKYSYDGGNTWTTAVRIVGQNGINGINGADGQDGQDGSDANVPSYITETYIDGTQVQSCSVIGGSLIQAGSVLPNSNTGVSNRDLLRGFSMFSEARYSGNLVQVTDNDWVGSLYYDSIADSVNGDNSQSQNRVWLKASSNHAIKISAGQGVSISGGSKKVYIDDCVFMGSAVDKNGNPIGSATGNVIAVFGA